MKRLLAGLLVACSALLQARAENEPEVILEILSDQSQFLPAEKLPITVRISNHSGRTLKFGRDNEWLGFTLEEVKGGIVNRRGDPKVEGEFPLDTATRGKFSIDLSPYFDLTRPGSYRLTAQMRVPELNLIVTSPPLNFDIIPGSIVWSQTFGVPPKSGDPDGTVDRRMYLLQQANYLKEVKLYVRVTDATTGATYAVFPIGPVVSFNKPQTLVDRLGQLHLLHQFGMRAYASHVISPDGVIIERRTYDITDSRPALRMNDQGEVIVLGGVRRPDASDIPALTATNAPPKEIPAPASPPRP